MRARTEGVGAATKAAVERRHRRAASETTKAAEDACGLWQSMSSMGMHPPGAHDRLPAGGLIVGALDIYMLPTYVTGEKYVTGGSTVSL